MLIKNKKFLVSLNLNLHSTSTKVPEVVVRLNDTQVDFTKNLEGVFGENVLSISFLNKHPSDTKLNDHGDIVEDLAVEITKFTVDGQDFTHEIKQQNNYVTASGVQQTYGFMHTNGVLTYSFVCPGFYYKRNINILNQE